MMPRLLIPFIPIRTGSTSANPTATALSLARSHPYSTAGTHTQTLATTTLTDASRRLSARHPHAPTAHYVNTTHDSNPRALDSWADDRATTTASPPAHIRNRPHTHALHNTPDVPNLTTPPCVIMPPPSAEQAPARRTGRLAPTLANRRRLCRGPTPARRGGMGW
eukprot:3375749-Prymnesium_polylepis.1